MKQIEYMPPLRAEEGWAHTHALQADRSRLMLSARVMRISGLAPRPRKPSIDLNKDGRSRKLGFIWDDIRTLVAQPVLRLLVNHDQMISESLSWAFVLEWCGGYHRIEENMYLFLKASFFSESKPLLCVEKLCRQPRNSLWSSWNHIKCSPPWHEVLRNTRIC